MSFRTILKKEREQRGWSQDHLAEKIHVSRQSVSKWETGKNYPNIEMIIDLSDLFGITIDELLRSDEELKEKVIQDSKQLAYLAWKSYFLFVAGILLGIMLVSILKNGEVNWKVTSTMFALSVLVFFSLWLIRIGVKRVNTK